MDAEAFEVTGALKDIFERGFTWRECCEERDNDIITNKSIIGERERANPCEQLGTFFRFYICDDPRSQKYGHVIRVSKIREWKIFRIVQYTC